jgi:hypothetical protein
MDLPRSQIRTGDADLHDREIVRTDVSLLLPLVKLPRDDALRMLDCFFRCSAVPSCRGIESARRKYRSDTNATTSAPDLPSDRHDTPEYGSYYVAIASIRGVVSATAVSEVVCESIASDRTSCGPESDRCDAEGLRAHQAVRPRLSHRTETRDRVTNDERVLGCAELNGATSRSDHAASRIRPKTKPCSGLHGAGRT